MKKKNKNLNRTGSVAQVVECLPSKLEALASISSPTKQTKNPKPSNELKLRKIFNTKYLESETKTISYSTSISTGEYK
jgi:hypothetical protein